MDFVAFITGLNCDSTSHNYKDPLRFQQNVIDFASVSLAVAVLMFSFLIGASNYSLRGEKMYQAGLELDELNRDEI